MPWTRPTNLVRVAGLLLGLGLAALAVLSWRVPAQGGPLGADLSFVATGSGELELSPADRFLSARSLTPGAGAAEGQLLARNQTGGLLELTPRALPSTRELDRLVMVELSAKGRPIYRGRLGGLRRGSRDPVRLASGASASLSVRAWIPRDSGAGWRGRIVDVQLDLSSRSEERRR